MLDGEAVSLLALAAIFTVLPGVVAVCVALVAIAVVSRAAYASAAGRSARVRAR